MKSIVEADVAQVVVSLLFVYGLPACVVCQVWQEMTVRAEIPR